MLLLEYLLPCLGVWGVLIQNWNGQLLSEQKPGPERLMCACNSWDFQFSHWFFFFLLYGFLEVPLRLCWPLKTEFISPVALSVLPCILSLQPWELPPYPSLIPSALLGCPEVIVQMVCWPSHFLSWCWGSLRVWRDGASLWVQEASLLVLLRLRYLLRTQWSIWGTALPFSWWAELMWLLSPRFHESAP